MARFFTTAEDLQKKTDEYFAYCDAYIGEKIIQGKKMKVKAPRPYTVEGLTAFLGFKNRKSLHDYGKQQQYEKFHDIIATAKAKIAANLVERALLNEYSTGMAIFILANNFDYHQPAPSPKAVENEGEAIDKIATALMKLNDRLSREKKKQSKLNA